MDSIFDGNTEESTRMNLNDWSIYCKIVYNKATVALADAAWPLSFEEWQTFLLQARPGAGSYKRFQGVFGNVCEVAVRYWARKRGMAS